MMKLMLAGSLIALTVAAGTPVLAQGVYVGPGSVGVDVGRHYDRDFDRDRYDRDEGRSVYRDRELRHDRDFRRDEDGEDR